MIVKPFRGLRPTPPFAARIPSYPYDVLDSDEARVLAAGDPDTFLHVVKAEIDLDPGTPPDDDRVYAKAQDNFRALVASGRMARDASPGYYVYRLTMGAHVQTGIVGIASVDDYLEGRIRRHEHTRPDKELDRTRHARAIGAHAGPVFLAHRGSAALEEAADRISRQAPAADFTSPDGIRHTLWTADAADAIEAIEAGFRALPCTYIADGHHRAAAYARLAQELRRERGADGRGPAPADFLLAAHFPAAQLRILDYNRLVRDLSGLSAEAFLDRVRSAGFAVREGHAAKAPPRAGTFGLYLGGRWRLLEATGPVEPDPVKRLDVSILADRLLGPILGIGDPRTDKRIEFVGGIRGTGELERRVDSGGFAVAFALYPTRIDDVMAVADAGEVMPPKSTWFEPKLRSGMVVHLFRERDALSAAAS